MGERVTVRNFRPGPAYVPRTVTNVMGPHTYSTCTENGQLYIDHLKPLGDDSLLQDEFDYTPYTDDSYSVSEPSTTP